MIEISAGVKYCHEHDIVHNDLKPSNLLFHQDKIILADFGYSVILTKNPPIKAEGFTELYAAPELLKERKYGYKTDIWSLGCILFELCTLKQFYNCISLEYDMHNLEESYSGHISKLIYDLLNNNPELRPPINSVIGNHYAHNIYRTAAINKRFIVLQKVK